jgi:voltage-gated potassium channel
MDETRRLLVRRIGFASFLLTVVACVGTIGYDVLGHGRWTIAECLYMTIITLSTVGFGELPGMDEAWGARAWTVLIILFGSGNLVYFLSALTAFVIEGDIGGAWKRSRMQQRIDSMSGHVVVCGLGSTGQHVIQELQSTKTPFVAIDADSERLDQVADELGDFPRIVGDVTSDHLLIAAGIRRASGVIICLHDDRDSLFVTLSARSMNDNARIISKADNPHNAEKLRRAGANGVVLPAISGGMRLASELLRPTVVTFLDEMLKDKKNNYRVSELPIAAGSALDGRQLSDTRIRDHGLVMAIKDRAGAYTYNPPANYRIDAGMVLVILARAEDVAALQVEAR